MTSGKTFFSYSRADSEFVLKLAKDLRSAGVDVWLDQLDIPAGKRWDAEIEQALESAQIQLVILSPSSVGSNNVMDEVSYALEKGKHVIPILIKECQIPFRLKRLQYINFTGSYDSGFKELLKALNLDKTKETQKTQNIPGDENIIATSESKVAIEKERNQKLEREAEQKRILQTRQDTTINSPLNKNTSADYTGMKKSPMKLIAAVGVIIVVLAIIIIVNMGPDENTPLQTQESELVDTESFQNGPNEENTETIQEEPNGGTEIALDYYKHDNGAFHREGNKWIETGLESNNPTFTFEETGRDADYIYIQDASRGMSLALPTVDGYCLILGNNELGEPEWKQLYYLRIVK